jgi:hypothetical protein
VLSTYMRQAGLIPPPTVVGGMGVVGNCGGGGGVGVRAYAPQTSQRQLQLPMLPFSQLLLLQPLQQMGQVMPHPSQQQQQQQPMLPFAQLLQQMGQVVPHPSQRQQQQQPMLPFAQLLQQVVPPLAAAATGAAPERDGVAMVLPVVCHTG